MRLKTIEFRKLICRRGVSIAELAVLAGMQAETIYGNLRYPDRTLRWGTLMRLCQALICEPEEIADLGAPVGKVDGTGSETGG